MLTYLFDSKQKKHFIRYETPIPNEHGLTKDLIVALVDISELKDKEKKLTQSRDAFLNMLKEIDFSYKNLMMNTKNAYDSLIETSFSTLQAVRSCWPLLRDYLLFQYALG